MKDIINIVNTFDGFIDNEDESKMSPVGVGEKVAVTEVALAEIIEDVEEIVADDFPFS